MNRIIGLLFLFVAGVSQAQSVKGKVMDEEGEPLISATVMLLQAEDSVLTSFAMSDIDGNFEIKKVDKGSFILRVNFVGYEPADRKLNVSDEDITVGDVILKISVLDEVVVETEVAPVVLKEDTIEYNTTAFKTRVNASVEDLLKKLPGVEVDRDGNITAEGETVNRVLVDGKEFFGDDPKTATKNLPAEAIDKVQVFDQKSRFAQFTGIEDGNETKTINLELKDSHKKGTFGNVRAGYGTDDRFDAAANVNQFRDDNQLSFIGNYNNINNAGNGQGGGNNNNNNTNSGLVTTASGGINFNRDFEKVKIRSNYKLSNTESINATETESTNFINERSYDSFQKTDNDGSNTNHALNVTAEYKWDETQDIQVVNRLTFTDSESSNESTGENAEEDEITSLNLTDRETISDSYNISSTLTYRKKLSKAGRSIIAELSYSDQNNESITDLYSFTSPVLVGDSTINQNQLSTNDSRTLGAEFSYTEPIGNNKYVEFRYERNLTDGGNDADYFDVLEGSEVFNDSLSSFYERKYDYSRAGVTFNYRVDKFSFNLGTNYQFSVLEGKLPDLEERFENEFNRLLPFARLRYSIGSSMNLGLNYTTRLNEPSITQLQPLVNNSDPLNISEGNPNLNAEYAHRLRLNFRVFDQFTQTMFFAFANLTYTEDNIVNSRTVDPVTFAQTTRPVNADDSYNLSFNASFSRPFRPPLFNKKFRLNLNNRWSESESFNIVNDTTNLTKNINNTLAVGIENVTKDVLDWAVGGTYTNGITRGTNESTNQDFVNQTYYLDLTFFFLKKWSLTSKFDYQNYGSASFAGDQIVRLWQASLQRNIMKNDRGELKLSAFDMLNENQGISRSTGANAISEQRSLAIGTYYMLTFTYRLSAFGDNSGGSFGRPARRRR